MLSISARGKYSDLCPRFSYLLWKVTFLLVGQVENFYLYRLIEKKSEIRL